MINVKRTKTPPSSLQNQAIKDYIDALTNWKENPVGEKPTCTAAYRTSDVIDAFDDCFFAKCYLTEKKFVSAYEMDIEHFYPKNEYPELKYEWTNLFPADHDANMLKERKLPEGGYLNPCEDDVENEIIYQLSFDVKQVFFVAKNNNSPKAVK
jgi:hypothetical protein